MTDPVDKRVKQDNRKAIVRKAVQKIAATEAGVIFFRWLKEESHFEHTTLSGDPQSHEVNSVVTVAREHERRQYLHIRQAFTEEQKFRIEVKQDTTTQD